MEREEIAGPSVLIRAAAFFGVVFLLAPLFIIVPLSFSSARYLTFPPPGVSLQWYERFLGDPNWLRSIWVSLQVAVFSSLLTVVVGVLAAFPLVRNEFRGKTIVYAVVLAPMIVPAIITAIALFFLFARLGLNGTVLAIAIGHAVVVLPIVIIIVSATLQNFDIRLEQAAMSLGAGRLRTFRKVTLPTIAPGIVSGALFSFLTSFDELIIPLFLGGPYAQTLSVRIWNSIMLEIEPTIAAVSTFLIAMAILVLVAAGLLRQRRPQRPALAG